jgi:hypothetical protein
MLATITLHQCSPEAALAGVKNRVRRYDATVRREQTNRVAKQSTRLRVVQVMQQSVGDHEIELVQPIQRLRRIANAKHCATSKTSSRSPDVSLAYVNTDVARGTR